LKTGSISIAQSPQFLIFGNDASEFLKKIYPFLLVKKDLAKSAYEYQIHINRWKGSKINTKEQNYRLKARKNIYSYEYNDEMDLEHIDNWIYPYFIGFFESSARIKINNKQNDYWINIRLKTKFEEILLLFQQIFDMGYTYPTRGSYFRWELNDSDAYNLLSNITPHLLKNRMLSETAIKIHEFIETADKPLNEKDIEYIENLKETTKKIDSNKVSSITILLCEELMNKIDQFISDSEGLSRSSIVKESILYYLDESEIPKSSSICEDKIKDRQINLFLDNDVVDKINKISNNRSELIRKLIELYLNHKQRKDKIHKANEKNSNQDTNPLQLLKDLRKK
jgi:metal-responsive CopG/Arc/MetJ family transcriptional regulator